MIIKSNWDKLDECSVSCCNFCCLVCDTLCIPIHFCLNPFVSPLERPYSFCFIVNFFLLITPSLLLLILIIHLNSVNDSYNNFYFIIGFMLCNLLVNFAVTFYIYYIYGVHKIEKEKLATYEDVRLFTKYIYNYVSAETYLKFVFVYYFCQVISIIMCLNWINNPDLKRKYEGIIVYDFTKFAVVCNAIFIFGNTIIYSYLFLAILCKVNFSCICLIISNYFRKTDNSENSSHQNEQKQYKLREDAFFVTKSLKFFRFFGIYDLEKAFPKKEENVIKLEND